MVIAPNHRSRRPTQINPEMSDFPDADRSQPPAARFIYCIYRQAQKQWRFCFERQSWHTNLLQTPTILTDTPIISRYPPPAANGSPLARRGAGEMPRGGMGFHRLTPGRRRASQDYSLCRPHFRIHRAPRNKAKTPGPIPSTSSSVGSSRWRSSAHSPGLSSA